MSALSADRVTDIYRDCLFKDWELLAEDPTEADLPENAIITEGVQHKTGFHPTRVEHHRDEIVRMLQDLPLPFRLVEGGGGGWSFLQACDDKDGNQWTGLHQTVDQLFQLGMAIGAVQYALPREIWPALPGGMPYMIVKV